MLKGWRRFQKAFKDNILKKEEFMEEEQKYDFKGQKIIKQTTIIPKITREQIDQFSRLEPELKPQSREIRLKNAFYMSLYMAWFVGCVLFIMYRLKSDDLEQMEKEAEARIHLREEMKKLRKESSNRLKTPKEF